MIASNLAILLQAMVLAGVLIMIAREDLRSLRIPNVLNLTLALLGLVSAALSGPVALKFALLSSLIIGFLFWLMQYVFKRVRGIDGLGMGDVKFAAAAGLWLTPFLLPWFVLISSLSGILHHLIKAGDREQRLPFGPHLAVGLFASWLLKILNVV